MDGKDMAYQSKSSTNVQAVCKLFYLASVRYAFEPIRVMKIVLHHADSCSMEVFRVSPKRHSPHFFWAKFKENFNSLNFENRIDTGN